MMVKGGELGVCANIFRVLFVIFNCFYMVFGVAALSLGIYSIVASETYDFVTGNDIISGAAIFIAVGFVIFIIGGVGVIGAIFRWRPLLVIYAIFWSSLIVLEVIAGILGFYYSSNVSASTKETYRNGWTRAIEQYTTDTDAMRVVDAFQRRFDCCGFDNASDWAIPQYFANNSQLPESCQCTLGQSTHCSLVSIDYDGMNVTQPAYNRGCYGSTVDFFQSISLVSGVVAITLAVLEVLGVFVAIGLVCCVTRAVGQYEVV